MLDYILKNIDEVLWKEFKAVAALEGKTVRSKLLSFIDSQGKRLPALVVCKGRLKSLKFKGGK